MSRDSFQIYSNICETIILANIWNSNCLIPKKAFKILAFRNNIFGDSYTYDEVWSILPKKKVIYKMNQEEVPDAERYTLLEPLIDFDTGEVVAMTNFFNITNLIHLDLIESYLRDNSSEFVFDCPIYMLDKVDKGKAGVLNKYFDEKKFVFDYL